MKRSYAAEMMDEPNPPAELLIDDLRNLRVINRWLGNYRNILRGLKQVVGEQKNFSLLDVGTGSGILAILAVKLGCASAIGTENDDVALPSARDNVVLNGVQDRVEMQLLPDPALLAPATFALVVANIISAVLVPMRDALVGRMAPGGTLVLSGILAREVEEVRDWYLEAGLTLVNAATQGDWASLTLTTA